MHIFRRGAHRRRSTGTGQTDSPPASTIPTCPPDPAGHGQSPEPSHSPAGPSHSHSPVPARHSSAENFESRPYIFPIGDSFENSVTVIREINKIVNNFWRGDSLSYSSTPAPTKELWWCEFKRIFIWDPSQELEIKRIFKKKCGDHIRHVLSHAKSTGKKPACVTSENWSKISTFWQTDESKKRSQQNKINQACNSGDLSATYAGGSINIEEHSRRLSKELGKEPEFIDTFVRTFQKKDKTWSGDRARAIKERYDQLSLSQRISGDDGDNEGSEPSVSNNLDLWLEASGGAKGGRILGMGSMSRTHNLPRRSLSSTPPAVTAQIHNLTEEVSNLKGIIFERDQQIAEIQQQRDQQIAEIQQQNSQRDQEMIEMRRQQAFLMQQFQQFSSGPSWIPPGTGDDGGDDDDID